MIERRVSMSRGPAHVIGTVMLAAGLYFLYEQHRFPPLANFPSGRAPVDGHAFFGVFGVNGWTGMGTAIAGGLLLFGSAQHHLAKGMSLVVGAAAGAAAIVAAVSGDVFGLAAANAWTEIGWGACCVLLLANVLLPARRRTSPIPEPQGEVTPLRRPHAIGGTAGGAAAASQTSDPAARPVEGGDTERAHEPEPEQDREPVAARAGGDAEATQEPADTEADGEPD